MQLPEFNSSVDDKLPDLSTADAVRGSSNVSTRPTAILAPILVDESPQDLTTSGGSVVIKRLGESVKYTAVFAVMMFALYLVRSKIQKMGITWADVQAAIGNVSYTSIAIAVAITIANFFVLTGYDLIAVRYLKKDLALGRVMSGAIIGYAFSNILGWMFGGTAVRYRLYSKWGFSMVEIVAFISILSITFWLGMFLLAGLAFVAFPVHLPEEYANELLLTPRTWGWIFLAVVGLYLMASAFLRKPIHWNEYRFSLPPLRLSSMQLLVSAGDFVLASLVLYVLLPSSIRGPEAINFSTVLVSYLAAMIVVVILHVPGGIGVLEATILHLMPSTAVVEVTAALVLYRVIYYLIPGLFAALLFLYIEMTSPKKLPSS